MTEQPKQTEPNIHDVLRAIRELEKHPAVAAYTAMLKSLQPRELSQLDARGLDLVKRILNQHPELTTEEAIAHAREMGGL